MSSFQLYQEFSRNCSKQMTHRYSSSFSLGIRMFAKPYRSPICAIYGFVRLADEIVDTFFKSDQDYLLKQFREETKNAIKHQISLNPILHSFQEIVNEYHIPHHLIDAFLDSMEMDLHKKSFTKEELKNYVYGSAEVVGLMCLCVFVNGNQQLYEKLKSYACSLGSAFQKINFLRDIKSDFEERGRVYFPNLQLTNFSDSDKRAIEQEIEAEFKHGLIGIRLLPNTVKLGVYIAYTYYWRLFLKIQLAKPDVLLQQRFRIPNFQKLILLSASYVKFRLDFITGRSY